MMAAFDSQETGAPSTRRFALMGKLVAPFWRTQPGLAAGILRVTVMVMVILVAAGSLVLTAAADTLPGDALYQVKRSWESARLSLTVDDSNRQALQAELMRRRREEVQAVQELRRPVEVSFEGQIESLEAEAWLVEGLALTITGETRVDGLAMVGKTVTVQAQVKDDGSLFALVIVVVGSEPPAMVTPTTRPQPTMTSPPDRNLPATRNEAAPSPTVSPTSTRPEPTPTTKAVDRPTVQPTRALTPSVDGVATRDPQPTSTRPSDSPATSTPRPTQTQAGTALTPVARPSDEAPSKPTPTAYPSRDQAPSPTPTATPNSDILDGTDRLP